ncbi:unnamed protein product [Heligmosomoides polygyrus]|uniref:30S ribosomal protein S8 n=1 Tax=Heligmosomoides polygyrus TaxID=6339 RepID=A0A183FFQ1_HELPZ|nr:unnamed protein product [Heligmosomoides polygyrus]
MGFLGLSDKRLEFLKVVKQREVRKLRYLKPRHQMKKLNIPHDEGISRALLGYLAEYRITSLSPNGPGTNAITTTIRRKNQSRR